MTEETWFNEVYTPEIIKNTNFAGMLYSQHPEEQKDNEIQVVIIDNVKDKDGVGFQFIISALNKDKLKGSAKEIWEEIKNNFQQLDEKQEKYFLDSTDRVKDVWEEKANLIGIRTRPLPISFGGISISN